MIVLVGAGAVYMETIVRMHGGGMEVVTGGLPRHDHSVY